MDQEYLKRINKALFVLSNPTNLYIAKKLDRGILSAAVLARLIYHRELTDDITESESMNTYRHLKDMEIAGVVVKRKQDFNKFVDYEITQIGKEALERKGYRNISGD